MRIERYIIRKFAERIETSIIAHSKKRLKQLGGNALLSGDDSPLLNLWDEICFQQQAGESFYWFAYQEVIDQIVLERIHLLDHAARLTLWIQTDEGFDWLYDQEDSESGTKTAPKDAPISTDEILTYMRGLLLRKAADEGNERVNNYHY